MKTKTVQLPDGTFLSYEIVRKNVKNLNLHLENSGRVWISAGKKHPEQDIETFVASKANWVKNHLDRLQNAKPQVCYFSQEELAEKIHNICLELFPYFLGKGISFPKIKFRNMTSQWGNCRPKQGILTFNKNLSFVPEECVRYVVCHEWTHFLVPNHSEAFYRELSKICPQWKERRKELKTIIIDKQG